MRDSLNDALARLEVGDRNLHAFLPDRHRRQRVLADADVVADRFEGAEPPDLFGVLVGVKDIINVDGLSTRAGSDLPAALFEGPEATMVRRLRGAGALVAGKTTTTEFAFSEPSRTRNPRDPRRTPGGSSSGSAVAVAAGLVPIALGTQTVDSIVTPAAYCGIVGFKPSYQRIPLDGVIPFSPSMDHGGILAADVATARLVASVVCNDWDEDPPPPGLVLGCPAADYTHRAKSRAVAAADDVIELLRRDGLAVVATSTLTGVEAITIAHRRLVAAEFARVHADWFSQYGDRYRRRTAGLYAEGAALKESAIAEGRESGRTLMRSVDEIMRREGIAAFVSPSTTDVAPLGLDYIGDPIMGVPWTHAHLPVVSLPIVSSPETLPLGIQLAGRPGRDEQLLGLAGLIETVLRAEGLWPT